jgi:type III restriction enzyme
MARDNTAANQSPILNNPYSEPCLHYRTTPGGELDYDHRELGRRPFVADIRSVPVMANPQGELMRMQDASDDWRSHLINLIRSEVGKWRESNYSQTTRITRELLQFWFLNEERDPTQSLFFAQREAIETAIWLNEVAEKSNAGTHILRQLEAAQQEVSTDPASHLPRVAFKMATGSGKTVVMAALILYHFYNRQEYGSDTRFADNFLIIAPGVTIRNRLGVLRLDTRGGSEADDYYTQRYLIPATGNWRSLLGQLNSKIVITNYHQFEPKTLQGNKRSPFDGKIGADGKKQEATEDYAQLISRLLGKFRGSRLLIINDEAHHCYLPRADDQKAEGEETKKENERAAVWFTGLREIAQRFKLRAVYDLSATPYYLTGSGHLPYSLFEWTVSDFGLIEAIESGLVKIPFLPTWDDTQQLEMPVLRNLYEHVRDGLPKAGQRKERARAKERGEKLKEAPPQLPDLLKLALKKFYEHYEVDFRSRAHSRAGKLQAQLELSDAPPVFIVVCNNTSVSKEVFKHLAGYQINSDDDGTEPDVRPGIFDLFTNFDPATRRAYDKPRTILIDSDALDNSGMIDDDYKRVFAPEIARFKRDYARVHGAAAADQITEAEILREVVNTVGKPNTLGAGIRCVVSVSMLTEGWDANTVSHIVGVRAFGSQLLCEQVAGRALRRRNYFLAPYDEKTGEQLPQETRRGKGVVWKFPPEYAQIIGVPFKLFKGGKTVTPPPVDLTRVHAVAERTKNCEIIFPNVEGYRIEYPVGPLQWDFSGEGDFVINGAELPTKTIMTGVGGRQEKLSIDSILAIREQEIIYRISKDLLRDHISEDPANPEFHRFHELKAVVADWYATKVRVLGKDDKWKKLLYFHEAKQMVAHVARGIKTGSTGDELIRPILNYYNPTGSTRFINGQTSRETYATRHSHANVVVLDTGIAGWEAKAAKTLDDLAEEKKIETWVKNAFLRFEIPYADNTGKERRYQPDFIVRATDGKKQPLMLIVEITGMKRDKAEKEWSVVHRWLPAVNAVRAKHDWPRWDWLHIDSEEKIADLRNLLLEKIKAS